MKVAIVAISLVLLASKSFAGAEVTDPPPSASVSPPLSSSSDDDGAALFVGLTWTFGNKAPGTNAAGLSVKLLSTTEDEEPAATAGITYHFDGTWGCDVGLGYNFDSPLTTTLTYDFCKRGPQIGLGGRVN